MRLQPSHAFRIFLGVAAMSEKRSRRGFTWIELLVIVLILAVLLGLLTPAIQTARENSRRQACTNNLKNINLAMQTHNDAYKRFPNSARIIEIGSKKEAGGWSFLFQVLPMLDHQNEVYSISPALRKDTSLDPLTNADPAIVKLRNTRFSEFLCPANPNKTYGDPANKLLAFTNYKAMGATCMESLKLCIDPDSPPPYGDKKNHPDGGLFPGNSSIRISDICDGMANTIMLAETIDDTKSAWIAGSDVTLVGMPKTPKYEKWNNVFWSPRGFNGSVNQDASPAIKALRTYTAFDFRPGQLDAGSYPSGVGRTPAFGPSTAHPEIVNHLYFDGGVRGIRKDVDYAFYFFEITRNNDDPCVGRCDL
jgi:type II secretory pathway pseudopilin PulG